MFQRFSGLTLSLGQPCDFAVVHQRGTPRINARCWVHFRDVTRWLKKHNYTDDFFFLLSEASSRPCWEQDVSETSFRLPPGWKNKKSVTVSRETLRPAQQQVSGVVFHHSTEVRVEYFACTLLCLNSVLKRGESRSLLSSCLCNAFNR